MTTETHTGIEDPWTVAEQDFPRDGTDREKLRFLLNYAVLAPSGHNTQPWLFQLDLDSVKVFADRSRALAVIDPDDRELIMSCGAAVYHLRVAMEHYGLVPHVESRPDTADPDLVAVVSNGGFFEPEIANHRRFAAIKHRRTYRLPFKGKAIPEAELSALQNAAVAEGCMLATFTESEPKLSISEMIAQGNRIQGSNKSFRRELAAWLHPNRSKSRDGMPGYAAGYGDFVAAVGPLVVRTFDVGNGLAARDRQLAEGSPCMAVLCTEEDDEAAWFAAGQALGRILLQAAVYGLAASFLNQPIEVLGLRARVADLVGQPYPQAVLRIGYGSAIKPTPRRPVSDVLL